MPSRQTRATTARRPIRCVDNPDSLLDVTDLVFIDPPGTGFTYLIGKTDPKEFYGVTADAKAVAQVIRRWLNDNGRWAQPEIPRRRKLRHHAVRSGGQRA